MSDNIAPKIDEGVYIHNHGQIINGGYIYYPDCCKPKELVKLETCPCCGDKLGRKVYVEVVE